MAGDRLRILHLTDLHMRQALTGTAHQSERLSRDIPKFLECLGDRLSEWTPDVIAVTGDLLDVPDDVVDASLSGNSPEAYAEAVAQATLDYRWMHDWLENTALDWVVIPGNHDHRAAFVDVFSTASPSCSTQLAVPAFLTLFSSTKDLERSPNLSNACFVNSMYIYIYIYNNSSFHIGYQI